MKNYSNDIFVVSCHLPRALPWAVLFCPFRAVRVFNFPGIFPVAGAFTQDSTLDCVLPIWAGALRPEGPAYYSPGHRPGV